MNQANQNGAQPSAIVEMSDFDRLMAGNYAPPVKAPEIAVTVETGKRWQVVSEIMAEVEVERELDYSITVCAICGLSSCDCRPRRLISMKKRISFPVEMAVATVITLQ